MGFIRSISTSREVHGSSSLVAYAPHLERQRLKSNQKVIGNRWIRVGAGDLEGRDVRSHIFRPIFLITLVTFT